MFKFTIPLNIQFYENRIKITRLDTEEVVEQVATQPFTFVRLLLGDFENGENCLKLALQKLKLNKFLAPQCSSSSNVHDRRRIEFHRDSGIQGGNRALWG